MSSVDTSYSDVVCVMYTCLSMRVYGMKMGYQT